MSDTQLVRPPLPFLNRRTKWWERSATVSALPGSESLANTAIRWPGPAGDAILAAAVAEESTVPTSPGQVCGRFRCTKALWLLHMCPAQRAVQQKKKRVPNRLPASHGRRKPCIDRTGYACWRCKLQRGHTHIAYRHKWSVLTARGRRGRLVRCARASGRKT